MGCLVYSVSYKGLMKYFYLQMKTESKQEFKSTSSEDNGTCHDGMMLSFLENSKSFSHAFNCIFNSGPEATVTSNDLGRICKAASEPLINVPPMYVCKPDVKMLTCNGSYVAFLV